MKRKADLLFLAIFLVFAAGIFTRCAKIVSPSGGPRDTIPPEVTYAKPPNYTTNFNAKTIEIQFNEFIQLKELKDQFISSPPFEKDPVIMERGDEIIIELKDDLKEKTTYTLNFGNAIVDFRESNPLRNFRYVFSTGTELDSLELRGKVVEALTKQPQENVTVMLYSNLKDSVPYQKLPEYVSRTSESGQYYIGNIRLDTFRLFALNDVNNNYLYDSPDELIGFSDSLVIYRHELIEEHDTVFADTLIPSERRRSQVDSVIRVENGEVTADTLHLTPADSMLLDTIFYRSYTGYPLLERDLRIFDEENRTQYFKTALRPDRRKISFVFNRPVIDSLRFHLIDSAPVPSNLYLAEKEKEEDTLTYWLRDSSIYNRELLTFEISYQRKDSLNRYYWHKDSVDVRYLSKEKDKVKSGRDTIQISTNLKEGRKADLDQLITLTSKYPLESVDTSRICLWRMEDSLYVEQDLRVYSKEDNLYAYFAETNWQPDAQYKWVVLPQTVRTLYDAYHDTLQRNFSTRKEDYYGNISMVIKNINEPFLLQLLSTKGNVLQEKWSAKGEEQQISYNYLNPAEYQIRLILDRNQNKKWDPGNYLNKKQPERVFYYPGKINVRANWDLDLEWNLKNEMLENP